MSSGNRIDNSLNSFLSRFNFFLTPDEIRRREETRTDGPFRRLLQEERTIDQLERNREREEIESGNRQIREQRIRELQQLERELAEIRSREISELERRQSERRSRREVNERREQLYKDEREELEKNLDEREHLEKMKKIKSFSTNEFTFDYYYNTAYNDQQRREMSKERKEKIKEIFDRNYRILLNEKKPEDLTLDDLIKMLDDEDNKGKEEIEEVEVSNIRKIRTELVPITLDELKKILETDVSKLYLKILNVIIFFSYFFSFHN